MSKETPNNWINYDINIDDINLGAVIKNLIAEAEELARENNIEYTCVADAIDVRCKNRYASGKITMEQWERVCKRYPIV